jgi:hypothetical protein
MTWNHSIEAVAAVAALVLLLFTPVLDPLVSLVATAVLLVGMIVLVNYGGRTGATRS